LSCSELPIGALRFMPGRFSMTKLLQCMSPLLAQSGHRVLVAQKQPAKQ